MSLCLALDGESQTVARNQCSQTRAGLVAQLVQRILGEGKQPDLVLGLGFLTCETKRNALQLLAKIVAKAVKTNRTTPVFLDNVLTCLEMVGMIGKEEEDSVTLLCHDSSDRDVTTFSLDIKLMKRHFEAVWLKFLNYKLTQDQYRYWYFTCQPFGVFVFL